MQFSHHHSFFPLGYYSKNFSILRGFLKKMSSKETKREFPPENLSEEEEEEFWERKYQALIKEMKEEFPYFNLVVKKHSKFNQLLKKLTVWNPEMNERYTTTLGPTIAVNNTWYERPAKSRYSTLIHERIHMRQQQKYGLTAFFLVFGLVPFPAKLAYYRKKWEQEAYMINLYMSFKEGVREKIFGEEYTKYIMDQFHGQFYLYMWYSQKHILKWLLRAVRAFERNIISWEQLVNFRRLPKHARPLRAPCLLRWIYPDDFL